LPHGVGSPPGLKTGVEVVVGYAPDLENAELLHPGHPLILGALAEARASTAQRLYVKLKLPETGSILEPHRGARGRYKVTKIKVAGFEQQERLLITVLLEGKTEPLPDQLAKACLELIPVDHPHFVPPLTVLEEDLEIAVEEAVFQDRAEFTRRNQDRFEQAMDQLERYVEDQLFVLRKDLQATLERLSEQKSRQNTSLASTSRKRAKQAVQRMLSHAEKLSVKIAEFERREDSVYQRGWTRAHLKQYATPETTVILDVEFELI
jgi:hypothetical protein